MIQLAYFLKFFFGIKCILKICVGKLTFVVMPNITGKGLLFLFILRLLEQVKWFLMESVQSFLNLSLCGFLSLA